MTETDATKRPTEMPVNFIPYVDKYRIYKVFKDMVRDLVIELPKDHLKHMKVFIRRHLHTSTDAERIIILVSPELQIDIKKVVKDLIKNLGVFVITRRSVIDRYEKHDDFVPGCMSPVLMSEVAKRMTLKEPVSRAGWLMFDHPCTVREARCLQQDGVLPTVTLVLMPPPMMEPPTPNELTKPRSFFEQDFEGLKFAYKATLKEVYVKSSDDIEKITNACSNGIQACLAGLQGAGPGHWVLGAPGVYRVVLIGPRGAGRTVQGRELAEHFGLVFVHFKDVYNAAEKKNDDIGERLRNYGPSTQLKTEILKRRLLKKDCVDHGWVLVGFPTSGLEFEGLENMKNPPNRIIIMSVDMSRCRARLAARGVDWCTGEQRAIGSGARVMSHPADSAEQLDKDLDIYFTEALAELRAAAGITAITIDANGSVDKVQVKLQAAVMAAPAFDIECGPQRKTVQEE